MAQSTSDPGLAMSIVTTVLALVFVLGFAWVMLLAGRRMQRRTGTAEAGDAPQVLRSVGLGPRERLVTVRYREREYLLGVTPASITLIERGAPEAPPRPDDGG